MIDLHSHILWGMDDGAADQVESLGILAAAWTAGTTDIVATPHCNAQYPYEPETVDRTLAELAEKSGGQPKVHRGCEFHLSFDNIDHLLHQPFVYTINSKQYLLKECPDFHVGRYTEGVLRRLVDAGLVPIIAHPERNPALRRKLDRVEAWVELGCLMQVTALSVTGGFGGSAKDASVRLLDRGLVHVIASDAHDVAFRHARLDEAYEAVRLCYGVDTAELLFLDNPEAIIKGLPVSGGKQTLAQPSRKWWQF